MCQFLCRVTKKRDLKCRNDLVRDLVLNREDVVEITVKIARPQVEAGVGFVTVSLLRSIKRIIISTSQIYIRLNYYHFIRLFCV